MDLDFEDLISQSIITNNDTSKRVSVETTQSREYDLVYNKKDASFHIKVKKDGFVCDECGEIYEEEHELTHHMKLQKCRKKYKTKAELKQVPFEYNHNHFLQMDLSTYNEIIEDNEERQAFEDDPDSDEPYYDEDMDVIFDSQEEGGERSQVEPEGHATYQCSECGRSCGSKIGLMMHEKMHKRKRRRKKDFT